MEPVYYEQALALITGLMTLLSMWLAGLKRKEAWVVGLLNQVFWVAFIVIFETWGLIPLTIALIFLFTRNYLLWEKEQKCLQIPTNTKRVMSTTS